MAFTIYDILFERVEFKQVQLLVVALCGALWICFLFLGTIPCVLVNIHIFPLHYTSLTWCHPSPTQQHSLCSQHISCSSAPSLFFLGTISHSSTLSAIPLLHCNLGAIPVIPCALSVIPVILCILGTIPLAPRLVSGWRRCLFLLGDWWKRRSLFWGGC